MVSPPVHVSVCPSPALGVGWFGHSSVAPHAAPVCWALLGSVAPFCCLSLWPHHLLLFSRLGFLPWAFVRTWVGRLQSCLGSCLLLWNSPSLVLVFAGRFLLFGCLGSWSFLGLFAWVLSSRFQCLLIVWGGCG